jgi:hypothetical protein
MSFDWRGMPAFRATRHGQKQTRNPPKQVDGAIELEATYLKKTLVHHWDSQGMPSPSPSISVFGQFFRKYLASLQEVI